MEVVGAAAASGLRPMLEARSVAVIGASPRPATVGHHLIRQLVGGGFSGSIHPVNPRHDLIEGLPVASHISEVGPVDLAVVAVANASLVQQVEAAIEAGARSLAIFASCHGVDEQGASILDRLTGLTREAGVPVCGGNGMGFLNLEHRLRISGFHQRWDLPPGGIAFLTHSGSLFSAMLHNRRHLRFNLVVSTGNELATTMATYLDHAVSLASTRVVAMFLETVRDPPAMAAALDRAAECDVPVVALKAGRTDRGRSSVATHSAALAGDHRAFVAFARAHGLHLVDGMEELSDTVALFDGGRRATKRALGTVHDSGGERTMLIDVSERLGVPLAQVGDTTRSRLSRVLDPGLEPENPVDAWGTGRDAGDVLAECCLALADDSEVGALVVSVDLTTEDNPEEGYGPTLVTIARRTSKPLAVLTNVPDAVDPEEARLLADAGIPVLRGLETGLRAIRHFFDHPIPAPTPHPPHPAADIWASRLATGRAPEDAEAIRMLSDFGIPTVETVAVGTEEQAVAAAERLGYPVAVKTTGHLHKSDVGGVQLGLADAGAVGRAYRAMEALGSGAVVQAMVPPGVEVALGMTRDDQFGPILLVAAGGTLVELLGDVTTSLPHLDHQAARRMLDELALRPLLDGARGRPPVHVDSLVEAVVAFGRMIASLDGVLESVDVNPLIAGPGGPLAVDALIVPRR